MVYLVKGMVEIGLKEGENFPTGSHRVVAENLVIGNPAVDDAEKLTKVVQYVLTIPTDQIRQIRLEDMPKDIQSTVTGNWESEEPEKRHDMTWKEFVDYSGYSREHINERVNNGEDVTTNGKTFRWNPNSELWSEV